MKSAASGPARNAVLLVVITLALLGALVWSIVPAQPPLKPAPLRPQPPDCPKLEGPFAPSDYTELPGVGLESLTPAQRNRALLRLNMEPCPCGCTLSIAACRLNHPRCETCKDLARKIVAEEQSERSDSSGR